MSEVLPEEWRVTALENCVRILDAQRVPINNEERQQRIEGKSESELFPYYGATGQVGLIDSYLFDEELVALGEDGVPFLDPLKNKAYLLVGKTWVNNHAHVLKAIEGVSTNKFLLYYLNQFDYQEYVNGATRLKLTQANMRLMPVNVPPLAEQQEIATRLDDLLAQVDTIKSHLDAIPAILKRFRQSVLAAAVSGKLFKNNTWEASTLAKIADSRLGKMLDKQKNQGSPHLYLRNVNVRWFNFDLSDLLEIKVSDDELEQLYVRKGDILVCEGGEPGRCAIWKQENNQYIFQKALHRVRVKNGVLPEWICFILKDAADTNKLDEYFTGTTIKHLTGQSLKQLPIPLPSLEEQTEIVRRVEQLFTFAEQIEQQVQAAQARVNNLTQAILAKAFKGELTADWRAAHPELISGENSAQALLDKIKAIPTPSKPKRSRAQQAELF
ncbi:MAG: restriction endonuclease subunit S [Thiolinea sp.]